MRPLAGHCVRARPVLAALMLTGACTQLPPLPEGTGDAPAAPAGTPPPVVSPTPEAKENAEIRAGYRRGEEALRAQGLLRTDLGGPANGLSREALTANFLRIAMYDEFDPVSGQLGSDATANVLRRWDVPVQISMRFGASVPDADRRRDREAVAELAARLSAATGLDIALAPGGDGNLLVYVVNESERSRLAPELRAELPGLPPSAIVAVTGMPLSLSCQSAGFAQPGAPAVYSRAVVIVRAEQPPLSRQSCYHEEIAQSLGLTNDSPDVRPSVFNDDDEFALLTNQDELMLRMLYDNRLSPGMTLGEVAPIAAEIAAELLPGNGSGDNKES